MDYSGGCHCGCVTFTFTTEFTPESIELRRCVCDFCRKHGAISVSDANGRFALRAETEASLGRYRFGLRTADFLFCTNCGVYLAALLEMNGHRFATVNVQTFRDADRFSSTPHRVNYEKDSAMDRVSKRSESWTPAVIEFAKK